MNIRIWFTVASALLYAGAAHAAEKDERAGTCSDAKQQMEYFCDEKNGATDSMVTFGTACTNAKKNVAAACEGKVEADQTYKFDDRK
jgi:hypothetical protein